MFGSNFLMKAMLKKQMKGVPQEEQDFILTLIEKHPDFFMKIAQETQEKVKGGMSEQEAILLVMKVHGEEFRALMGK